jgi:hypothetical protein
MGDHGSALWFFVAGVAVGVPLLCLYAIVTWAVR